MKSFWVATRLALVISIALSVLPNSIRIVVAQRGPVTLPLGSIVVVRLDEQVTGKTHSAGASVSASVARDVVVDSVLVIRVGTPVDVTVAQASKAGMVGQAGDIALNIEQTTTVDNQVVFLRGMLAAEGQGATGASVGAGVVLCPLFLMMKGKEGVINAGTEFRAKTQNVVSVQEPESQK